MSDDTPVGATHASPLHFVARVMEALVFASDKPLSLATLAEIARCSPDEAKEAADLLESQLAERGINLFRHLDSFALVTAPDLAGYIERLQGAEPAERLTPSLMETLAAVSYLQPATRAEVENLRGVNCAKAIYTLQAMEMIEEAGLRDEPGQPAEYVTTGKFLLSLGLRSNDELAGLLNAGRDDASAPAGRPAAGEAPPATESD